MTRYLRTCRLAVLLGVLLLLPLLPAPARAAEARPNVVILLADDQGWGDLSINGNTTLQTPHIDSLGRDGALFDRFYVCPVCSPTRAEFLTGRYHPRGGVRGVSVGEERLDLDERTIAQIFRQAGYATGAFGKWHNGSQWPYHPNGRGFDEYYGFTAGHWGEYFDPPLEQDGQPVRGKGYIADDLTDHAIAFIERHRARPFLCYLPFNTPHSPFAVPQDYWRRFDGRPIPRRGPDGEGEDLDVTRCALAMCENIDHNVGRILETLQTLGLARDTIVLYFSDNGPNSSRWNGGMKGRKGSVDEGGVRVPSLIRWPARIPSGQSVREIAGAIDLLPTLAALAGVPLPADRKIDGIDLSPLLLGRSPASWPDRTLFSYWNGRLSARTRLYRLDDAGALFDMVADPGQTRDLAGELPEVARAMRQSALDWCADVIGSTPAPEAIAPDPAKAGKRKAKARGRWPALPPDDRPYPVGYPAFPTTPLPARDGVAHGGIRRSSNAPNCSYFVNWTDLADSITWEIEVQTAGTYVASIDYTCPLPDAGSTVELSFGGARVAAKVEPGWDPPLKTDQDTIPRPAGESQMKDFRTLTLGTLRLVRGRGPLALRALTIPGRSVMDVRRVTLLLKID